MGLSIHYTLKPRHPIGASEATSLVSAAHAATAQLVRDHAFARVSDLQPAEPDNPWLQGTIFRKVDTYTSRGFSVPPKRGSYFHLTLAPDCEPAFFGRCEYPAILLLEGGRRLRTGLGGWRFRASCKTQYASLHGWEPFLASHRLVIDAALVWENLGFDVQLLDEGDYWPGDNTETLAIKLNQINGIVAAMGGALKDATNENGPPVQSPIFAHPQFERLEAEGLAANTDAIGNALRLINPGDLPSATRSIRTQRIFYIGHAAPRR